MTDSATTTTPAELSTLDAQLQSYVGLSNGPRNMGPDPVNLPMIRHWVEAMGDYNPVYVDDAAAKDAGYPGIIAPPTMLQAWIMRGLRTSLQVDRARAMAEASSDSPTDRLMAALDDAGFTSVVATNCDQHYERPLVPGDEVSASSVIDAVSGEKATASTPSRCPLNVSTSSPVATSQSRTSPSHPAVARRLPSGLNARAVGRRECPRN